MVEFEIIWLGQSFNNIHTTICNVYFKRIQGNVDDTVASLQDGQWGNVIELSGKVWNSSVWTHRSTPDKAEFAVTFSQNSNSCSCGDQFGTTLLPARTHICLHILLQSFGNWAGKEIHLKIHPINEWRSEFVSHICAPTPIFRIWVNSLIIL